MAKRRRKPPANDDPPRVYSYARFSTPEQATGDSMRRQTEQAEAWCKDRGFTLDKSLRMSDQGVSGFRGANADIGALASFFREVEVGNVPRGSFLLVESLDRLSRDRVKMALARFLELTAAGVTIVAMQDGQEFSGDGHDMELIIAITLMSRAHEESATKSKRRAARWAEDRKKMTLGVAITGMAPEWLKKVGDRYQVVPERAEAVRRLFELRAAGYGAAERLAQKLNEEAVWLPAGKSTRTSKAAKPPGWRRSYVQKILNNRAVIGQFQPHKMVFDPDTRKKSRVPVGDPIDGYYPAIVDRELFDSVQPTAGKKPSGGQTGRYWNVFRGLVRCGYCGGAAHFEDKGPTSKGGQRLYCDDAKRGVRQDCTSSRIRYGELQRRVLEVCSRLDPSEVLPNASDRAKQIANARRRVKAAEAESKRLSQEAENLTDAIASTPSAKSRERLSAKLDATEDQLEAANAELQAAKRSVAESERSSVQLDQWQRDLGTLIERLSDRDAVDERVRLNSLLREHITRIELMPLGYAKPLHFVETRGRKPSTSKTGRKRAATRIVPEQSTDDIADYCLAFFGEHAVEAPAGFVDWLVEKRLGRDGAFARIRFATGASIDVPVGQYASGRLLKSKEIVHHEPDLNAGLNKFRARKNHQKE